MPVKIRSRVFYWVGPLAIVWNLVLTQSRNGLEHIWNAHRLQGGSMEGVWFGIAAASLGVLALLAFGSCLALNLVRSERVMWSQFGVRVLPHLLLCAVIIGTAVVLGDSQVHPQLAVIKVAFVEQLLFAIGTLWGLVAVLSISLSTEDIKSQSH